MFKKNVVTTFCLLVIVGGLALYFLPTGASRFPFIDSLFTSFCAVTLTGFSTFNIAVHLNSLGQAIVLLLIQAGGLGFMTLATLVVTSGKVRIGSLEWGAATPGAAHAEFSRLLKGIVLYTVTIEAIGALALYSFVRDTELSSAENIFRAVFQSVSAFCNVGMSILPRGFLDIQQDPLPLVITGTLIILGGLGFVVLAELKEFITQRITRLSVHAKAVLNTTAFLLVAGTIILACCEWNRSLAEYAIPCKVARALFLGITARSGGFASVSLQHMQHFTVLVLCGLMVIGGSPGSTAGGIKTTTVHLLYRVFMNKLLGRQTFLASPKRRFSPESFFLAVALVLGAFCIITLFFFFILIFEGGRNSPLDPMALLFETVSAFGTVGLSMGVTEFLSGPSKGLLMVLMFIGRFGPLSLLILSSKPALPTKSQLPEERILVG